MPLDNIDPEIVDFVDEYIDQFACWDILVYFHENPDVEKKCSGIALDIGRREGAIAEILQAFVEKDILACDSDEAGEPTFRYAATAEVRHKMDLFIAATRDRTNRLAIVSRVLQKEARRL